MRLSRRRGGKVEAASTGEAERKGPPDMTLRLRLRRPLRCARLWTEGTGMEAPGAGPTERRGPRRTHALWLGARFQAGKKTRI